MPHRLRPLRLLTLSEPYRCLYWLLHKHEVAGEEGVRMGPFLLYEDRISYRERRLSKAFMV